MKHSDRESWSIRQSTLTVTPTGQRSRRINTQCSLLQESITHLRRELSTTSTCQNVRMKASRGALRSTWTQSIAQTVSQVCRQSAQAARRSVGWAIEAIAMVIWISTALSDAEPSRNLLVHVGHNHFHRNIVL